MWPSYRSHVQPRLNEQQNCRIEYTKWKKCIWNKSTNTCFFLFWFKIHHKRANIRFCLPIHLMHAHKYTQRPKNSLDLLYLIESIVRREEKNSFFFVRFHLHSLLCVRLWINKWSIYTIYILYHHRQRNACSLSFLFLKETGRKIDRNIALTKKESRNEMFIDETQKNQ